jgi:hypothetical protein
MLPTPRKPASIECPSNAMRQRGESRSDWAKSAAMTSEEIEAGVASDPDEADLVMDWDGATVEMR